VCDWEHPCSHETGEEHGLPPAPNDEIDGLEVKTVLKLVELIILPRPLDTPLLEFVDRLFLSASDSSSVIESKLVPEIF